MKRAIWFSLLAITLVARASELRDRTIDHSISFFDRYAWDERSGSYASEIRNDGSRVSETRHVVALSRMIYGLAKAGRSDRAARSADFLLRHLVARDGDGPYFRNAVDGQGRPLGAQEALVVYEQAYGLCGLVALYETNRDPALLARIHELHDAFERRFRDPVHGGYFDTTKARTKSYASTVYVATSFLFHLHRVEPDARRRAGQRRALEELARIVEARFFDPASPWIFEDFRADWTPEWRGWHVRGPGRTAGEVGHNAQAAWFLLRAVEAGFGDPAWRARATRRATGLLETVAERGWDREYGGLFGAIERETGRPVNWGDERKPVITKAWWQHTEALVGFALALKLGVGDTQRLRAAFEDTLAWYQRHFVDEQRGGEYFEVWRDGTPNAGSQKGAAGKSVYHVVEMAVFLDEYGR